MIFHEYVSGSIWLASYPVRTSARARCSVPQDDARAVADGPSAMSAATTVDATKDIASTGSACGDCPACTANECPSCVDGICADYTGARGSSCNATSACAADTYCQSDNAGGARCCVFDP